MGRVAEMRALAALTSPAGPAAGRRLAVIAGEAGSGKSRLVREASAAGAREGVLVLLGAGDPEVRTAYHPFVDALRHLVEHGAAEDLAAGIGPRSGELARVLPELAARVGGLPAPLQGDADTQRHHLHVAVTDLLVGVGRRRRLLLVVEDAHWADASSLHLLRHLVRAGVDVDVPIVVTHRDLAAEVPPELADALAVARRLDGVARIRLQSLGDADLRAFVSEAAGLGPDAVTELAAGLAALTGGNPLLVCETWRALVESGGPAGDADGLPAAWSPDRVDPPDAVRELVRDRLGRLPAGAVEALQAAAVVGPEFEAGVVAAALGVAPGGAMERLASAEAAGILERFAAPVPAYRFGHELVRRAILGDIPAARRPALHLAVADALEGLTVAGVACPPADIAHHLVAAAPLGVGDRAARHAEAAAERAMAALAFDEAADWLTTALALDTSTGGDAARRELRRADAYVRSGRVQDAVASFRSAAARARYADDVMSVADAALGLEEVCWRAGIGDDDLVRMLRGLVGDGDVPDAAVEARLRAALARALVLTGHRREAVGVAGEAEAAARATGDARSLADVLIRLYPVGAGGPDAVLRRLVEAREIGRALGDPGVATEATLWTVVSLVRASDLAGARRELSGLRGEGERTGQPFILYATEAFGAAVALMDGRLDDAERLAERSREWGLLLRGRDPSGMYGMQMFSIRREQGRLAEIEHLVRLVARRDDGASVWAPGLVALLVELGMRDEAAAELRRLREAGFPDAEGSGLGLASVAYLAEAAAAVGDAESAAILMPRLTRHTGRLLVVGHLVVCEGAADRHLGALAATMGDLETADRYLARALDLERSAGADALAAHTAATHAALLRTWDRPGDRARAAALGAYAGDIAGRRGLERVRRRVGDATPAAASGPLPDDITPREAAVLALVAQGLSNREIGTRLVISEHTAANHVRSILRKTGSANRTEAAGYAHRHGLA